MPHVATARRVLHGGPSFLLRIIVVSERVPCLFQHSSSHDANSNGASRFFAVLLVPNAVFGNNGRSRRNAKHILMIGSRTSLFFASSSRIAKTFCCQADLNRSENQAAQSVCRVRTDAGTNETDPNQSRETPFSRIKPVKTNPIIRQFTFFLYSLYQCLRPVETWYIFTTNRILSF